MLRGLRQNETGGQVWVEQKYGVWYSIGPEDTTWRCRVKNIKIQVLNGEKQRLGL